MHRHALCSLALAALLTGCAEPPPDGVTPICAQQQGLRATQGKTPQGLQLNGFSHNAVGIDAIRPNALIPNGIRPNALTSNGIRPYALSNNGIRPNALTENGLYLNGIRPNGSFNGIALQGTELRAVWNGRVLEGEAWVGMALLADTSDGGTLPLTITAVSRDPADPEITYFSLALPGGENICGPEGKGLFVAGQWDETGAHRTSERMSYSCAAGVIAKCLVWGYKPWRVGSELHQTCTRMARADYCGDGQSHTENGTPVDLFDGQGIQAPASVPGDGFTFEAGWGPDGAVCVSHPRYRVRRADGETVYPRCWNDRPRCRDFREAQRHGALMANASIEKPRLLCED